MKSLSNGIFQYYTRHFNELPLDKQFHFASRLNVWNKDEQCHALLWQLKPRLLPENDPRTTLSAIAKGEMIPLLPGNERLLQSRQTYNDRYPQLRATSRLLYWAAMLDQAYDIGARTAIPTVLSESDMQQLYKSLQADDDALAMLSTHAVNFLYLYSRYYRQEDGPDPSHFGRIAASQAFYDMSNPLHVQLCTYLLTHAVIADSLFYAEPLPQSHRQAHAELLSQLDSILEPQLTSVSLDNKLEFLVSCQLVGFKSKLEPAIMAEATESVSTNGTFLVDAHNTNASSYTSLEKSEHRNALYIMINTPRQ